MSVFGRATSKKKGSRRIEGLVDLEHDGWLV